MNLIKITACVLLTLAAALPASAAGTANGGGGKGVVCRNADGSIRSVELLDLWEASQLRGIKPKHSNLDLPTLVELALKNLQNMGSTGTPNDFLRDLKIVANRFLNPKSTSVVRLKDARLDLTQDSDELIQPRDCEVEQIVNYQPAGAKALIDQTLFEKMDTVNQAALIAHEAFYAFLRQNSNATNSVRTRRAVSEVMSTQKPLPTLPQLEWEEGQVACNAEPDDAELTGGGDSSTLLVFSKDKMQIDFRSLSGAMPIGISNASRKPDSPWMPYFPAAFFGDTDCKKWSFTFGLDGPVEYDTTVVLYKGCVNGKVVRKVGVRNPGEKTLTVSTLHCRPLQQGEWGNE